MSSLTADLTRKTILTIRTEGIAKFLTKAMQFLSHNGIALYYRLTRGDTVIKNVHGSEMILDTRTPGIHRQLLVDGQRESHVTDRFSSTLLELGNKFSPPIHVFDIGANIGYYALLEASILGEKADIHCFEPDPRNVERLEANLSRNGYDSVTVVPEAIGRTVSTATLKRHRQPNLHQLEGISERESVETIDVPVSTIDGYIESMAIDDDALIIVRMDIEGAETEAFDGMAKLLDSDRPMYIFMEVHKFRYLDEDGQRTLFDRLEDSGFKLDYANVNEGDIRQAVTAFDELSPIDQSIHLMARRL